MTIAEHGLEQDLANVYVALSREQQDRLREAALRTGTSLSAFAVTALVQAADAVLDQPPPTVLSERDFDVLMYRLEADAAPNAALQAAADDYKRRLAAGTLHVEH